jgi:hypothetical protein
VQALISQTVLNVRQGVKQGNGETIIPRLPVLFITHEDAQIKDNGKGNINRRFMYCSGPARYDKKKFRRNGMDDRRGG